MTGSATVLRGDARRLPLADASVDLIVTSPPYFALRSYTDGGEHYDGQIGGESTPAEYVAALVECTREWMRVLKPGGSMFVNLGDSYSGRAAGPQGKSGQRADRASANEPHRGGRGFRVVPPVGDTPAKSLRLLPERYRIACVDELGLIARAVIVWDKPNGLPESVTDRARRSHEDWVHLTRAPRYFSAVDTIREAYAPGTAARYAQGYNPNDYQTGQVRKGIGVDYSGTFDTNPLGKLPGSVWTVPTQPLKVPAHLGVDHFAAFPMEWPRRLILGWSPSGICTACGEGRRPVATKQAHGERLKRNLRHIPGYDHPSGEGQRDVRYAITGEACACTPYTDHPGTGESSGPSYAAAVANGAYVTKGIGGAKSNPSDRPRTGPWREYHHDQWTPPPTRPAVVLDPCGGTGTTALVAKALGRHGITVDMSADYCCLAEWRTTDPGQLAAALQVPKPPPQADGQIGFDFEGLAS